MTGIAVRYGEWTGARRAPATTPRATPIHMEDHSLADYTVTWSMIDAAEVEA